MTVSSKNQDCVREVVSSSTRTPNPTRPHLPRFELSHNICHHIIDWCKSLVLTWYTTNKGNDEQLHIDKTTQRKLSNSHLTLMGWSLTEKKKNYHGGELLFTWVSSEGRWLARMRTSMRLQKAGRHKCVTDSPGKSSGWSKSNFAPEWSSYILICNC